MISFEQYEDELNVCYDCMIHNPNADCDNCSLNNKDSIECPKCHEALTYVDIDSIQTAVIGKYACFNCGFNLKV